MTFSHCFWHKHSPVFHHYQVVLFPSTYQVSDNNIILLLLRGKWAFVFGVCVRSFVRLIFHQQLWVFMNTVYIKITKFQIKIKDNIYFILLLLHKVYRQTHKPRLHKHFDWNNNYSLGAVWQKTSHLHASLSCGKPFGSTDHYASWTICIHLWV